MFNLFNIIVTELFEYFYIEKISFQNKTHVLLFVLLNKNSSCYKKIPL